MEKRPRKKKGPSWPARLLGFVIGGVSWFVGLHCLEAAEDDRWNLSFRKAFIHFSRVLGWGAGLFLLIHGFHQYFLWFLTADPTQRFLAVLGKTILFLYIRLFWPGLLTRILPGAREFFCPQCYSKRVFRFQPVASSFGNWVTYLCGHCSCLVDGWGGQIFFPRKTGMGLWARDWVLLPLGSVLSLGLGVGLGELLVRIF